MVSCCIAQAAVIFNTRRLRATEYAWSPWRIMVIAMCRRGRSTQLFVSRGFRKSSGERNNEGNENRAHPRARLVAPAEARHLAAGQAPRDQRLGGVGRTRYLGVGLPSSQVHLSKVFLAQVYVRPISTDIRILPHVYLVPEAQGSSLRFSVW